MVELIISARQAGGGTLTPLGMYRPRGGPACMLTAGNMTVAIREQVRLHGATVGLAEREVSARLLRNGGAQALINSGVDTDRIDLIGRWKSGAMLRYLIVQARPVMRGYAARMLSGGSYDLLAANNVNRIPAANPQDPYAGDPYD